MGNMLVCPWLGAFRAGRVTLGLLILAMQLSLVLWPIAVRWAKQLSHEHRIQALLDQISVNYARHTFDKAHRSGGEDADASVPEAVA